MSKLEDAHRGLLERWRNTMNLVGPGDVQDHFDDCRLALAWLKPSGRWLDLGSGAGFPGLVLADMSPGLQVDLVESRAKRCIFLETVLADAAVPTSRVAVLHQRVEKLDQRWDGVVSRAFAPPENVLECARDLLNIGGTLVLFLQADREVEVPTDWRVFHVEHYVVCGKSRKAMGLVYRE